jgi:hypothetical protein
MQTSKIKVGEVYAMKRGSDLIRFQVTAIISRKTLGGTGNTIEGFIVEDARAGTRNDRKVDPKELIGPFTEQAELAERKAKENVEHEAKQKERENQALFDRLALYEFVGVTPPKDPKEYHQHFRATFGSVDIRNEGQQAIIDRVKALREPKLSIVKEAK